MAVVGDTGRGNGMDEPEPIDTLDTFGLLCPMPIIKLGERMRALPDGALLEILSDDPGIVPDLPAWCGSHGHEVVSLEETAPGEFRGLVRKRIP